MRKLSSVLHVIDTINDRLGKIFSFIIVVMIGVMLWDIFVTYVFRAPTKWAVELTGLIFGTHFILGGAFVLLHRGHISMDVVYSRLSVRTRAILDVITFSLFLSFCCVLVWHGWELFSYSLKYLEHSVFAEIPFYPFKVMIPIGGSLLLLQGLAKFIRDLTIVIRGEQII